MELARCLCPRRTRPGRAGAPRAWSRRSAPSRLHLGAWLSAFALLAGCHGRDDLDGRRRPVAGLPPPGQTYAIALGDARPVFDLFDNRAAAVVHDQGALVIECGTADMVKYVEGAYRSPWHLHARHQGQRTALVAGLAGELYLPVDADPGGVGTVAGTAGGLTISLWARPAKAKQLVSVFLNERRLGDIAMPETSWQSHRIQVPAGIIEPGENKLRFYFRHTADLDGVRTAAAIARVRVGAPGAADAMAAPALAAGPVTREGGRLDALQVSRPSRLSFYLAVPAQAPALIFAHAAPARAAPASAPAPTSPPASEAPAGPAPSTKLAVHVATTQATATRVWQATAGATWTDARVDLAAYAGQIVRIDLVSEGPADWGRPQLVVGASDPGQPPALPVAQAAQPTQPAPGTGSPAQRLGTASHIIVWVVSALRADRVFGAAVPTPGFTALAERGLGFLHAITAAPAPGAAHVAMLTGHHPRGSEMPGDVATLAERLSGGGFITALISGNGFINDEVGFARGFSVYENPMRRRHPFHARVLWQRARRLLQRHADGRTFLYIVTVEPHLPYRPSPESLAAEWDRGPARFEPTDTIALAESVAAGAATLTPDEQTYVEALYDATVRDADAAFAAMLADLEQLGVADRTAVILVSDHGEELWERGGFGHGRHLHQEVLRVPLLIGLPRGASGTGRTVDRAVTLLDLFPTVLALAGLPVDPQAQGESLLEPASEPELARPLFAHLPGHGRSLELAGYKLIVPMQGPQQLYDLDADPGEQRDRFEELPLIARYLRNVFGIGVAYEQVWSRKRWGHPGNVRAAFAADHGL
jgi:arylsulfatase A-like enzyme